MQQVLLALRFYTTGTSQRGVLLNCGLQTAEPAEPIFFFQKTLRGSDFLKHLTIKKTAIKYFFTNTEKNFSVKTDDVSTLKLSHYQVKIIVKVKCVILIKIPVVVQLQWE